MMCQILFTRKIETISLSSSEFVHSMVSVKNKVPERVVIF